MLKKVEAVCAYRHCNEVFVPKRKAQRFCSQRCQKAYAYDVKRAGLGVKNPRKTRLGTGIARSHENGHFFSIETVDCKHPQPSVFAIPLDLLGRGYRWPDSPSIGRGLWAAILQKEGCRI